MFQDEIFTLTKEVETLKKENAAGYKFLTDLSVTCKNEKRSTSGEEETAAQRCMDEMKGRDTLIDAKEKELRRLQMVQEGEERNAESKRSIQRSDPMQRTVSSRNEQHEYAWDQFLRSCGKDLTHYRNLNVGSAAAGIEALPPQEWVAEFWRDVQKSFPVLGLCTNRPLTNSPVYQVPTIPTRMTRPTFKSTDTTTSTNDTGLTTGNKSMTPHKLPIQITVSNYWLALGGATASNIVRSEMAECLAEALEYYVLNGDSTDEPRGVFLQDNAGIPGTRDVIIHETITFPGLLSVFYALPSRYRNRPTTAWLGSDSLEYRVARLVDDNNHPIFMQSLSAGVPPTLFGKQFISSTNVPAVFDTGQYCGILADWSGVLCVNGPDFGIKVYDQPGYATDETIFKSVVWFDSTPMPVRAEGFARIECGDGSAL